MNRLHKMRVKCDYFGKAPSSFKIKGGFMNRLHIIAGLFMVAVALILGIVKTKTTPDSTKVNNQTSSQINPPPTKIEAAPRL